MVLDQLRTDCIHFQGGIPCHPHKKFGVHCTEPDGKICPHYLKTTSFLLLIKLGAAGDVIRTTPLLPHLRKGIAGVSVIWLTKFTDLVPSRREHPHGADLVLEWNSESLTFLSQCTFDKVINLDKDIEACALASSLRSNETLGYILKDNKPFPARTSALKKYMTGIFDDISQANTESYIREIFEVAELPFVREEYILPSVPEKTFENLDKSRPVIGLNTGCGGRWPSRLWPEGYWIELARRLRQVGFEVVLLGGPEERERNERIAAPGDALHYGVMPLKDFMALVNRCDVVVSSVTMAIHLAIGLKKRLVLLNNIFNKYEFELYGRGVILEPSKPCRCYYSPRCVNDEYHCIDLISVGSVYDAVCAEVAAIGRSRK